MAVPLTNADLEGVAVTIPVPKPGTPLFDERVTLDGTDYILTFDWHEREKRWYMHVSDATGNIITAGIKLIPGWFVYRRETLGNSPKGDFIATSPDTLPPALADFGLRSQLLYFPPTPIPKNLDGVIDPNGAPLPG